MKAKVTSRQASFAARRVTLARIAGAATAACLGPLTMGARAQTNYVEGTDFDRLPAAIDRDAPGKIEVMEFFAYWCPHCYDFDPRLNEWALRQPADVALTHVPVAFNDTQVPYKRMYYVLQALGREKDLRAKVFGAIHRDRNPLNTIDSQAEFAGKNGLDAKKYRDLYDSFSIQTAVGRASQLANAAGVTSIPTLVVDGRFVVSSTQDNLLVAEFLVGAERRATGKKG